jgi:uncharacterized RDD family membrane protein YckC
MTTTRIEPERDVGYQGHYAGIVTRAAAFLVDAVIVALFFTLGGKVVEFVVSSLRGEPYSLSDHPVATRIAAAIWVFAYAAYQLAVAGRTVGKALFGLLVVRHDGRDLDARHAALRVLVLPLSFLLFGFGFLLILVNRDRRALHDLIADTAVVYNWDARAARLRFLARRSTTT